MAKSLVDNDDDVEVLAFPTMRLGTTDADIRTVVHDILSNLVLLHDRTMEDALQAVAREPLPLDMLGAAEYKHAEPFDRRVLTSPAVMAAVDKIMARLRALGAQVPSCFVSRLRITRAT